MSRDAAVHSSERADDPVQEGRVEGWRVILDLSDDASAVATYCLLRDAWWPHPAHGGLMVDRRHPQLLVFHCVCGDHIAFPEAVAYELGLIA